VSDVLEFALTRGLSPTLCKLLDLGNKTVIMMDNCGQVESNIAYMAPEKALSQVKRARQLLTRSSWRCLDYRVTTSGYFLDYSALVIDGLDDETDAKENQAYDLAMPPEHS